jgi:hypothetical protein
MPTVIGSHSVASFVNPSNGDALDANVVKGNDNTLRAAYVNHDADPGVHVQSSPLAARPAAGVVGRKWMTVDGGVKLWYDTGSVWQEIAYVPSTGTATLVDLNVTNALTVDGTTLVVDAVNNRVGVNISNPSVALDVIGAARTSSGITVTSGGITVAGNSSITGNLSVSGALSIGALAVPAANVQAGTFAPGNFAFQNTVTAASVLATNGQMRGARVIQSGSGGTVSFATANHVRHTMTGNGTLVLTGGVAGGVYTVEVLQDGTGGRTVAWSGVVWAGGVIPSSTATPNRKDVFTFYFDGSNYLGVPFGLNFASTA